MGLALSLSIIREGSEILIDFSWFIHNKETLSSGIIGSIIGPGLALVLVPCFISCSAHSINHCH